MIRPSAPPISGSMAMAELLKVERLSAGSGEAQVLFDNPEEYARNFSACGGEIARLVKPAASTKSGKTPG